MKNISLVLFLSVVLGGGWYVANQLKQERTASIVNPRTPLSAAPSTRVNGIQTVELNDGDSYDMVASIVRKTIAGSEVKMLAYNGLVPGPTLKVKKGAAITINFTNNSDVPTTLHSHGVRLDNKYDGVPDATQKAIPVGGTFTYKVKFPDEGVFWYHPHIREDYAQELGLYGNYIVVSDDPNYWAQVNQELPLDIDDILMENGKVASFGAVADHALMGRFGNVMLVNGTDNYHMSVRQGEVVRFFITNTANTRVFNLAIPGGKMKLVGGDNGKYERETFVDSVIIGPSERAVVEVLFSKAGEYAIEHHTPKKTYTMGAITVNKEQVATSYASQFLTQRTNKDTILGFDQFRSYVDKQDDKNLSFTVDMGGMGGSGGHMMSSGMMMGKDGAVMGSDSSQKIEWEDSMSMMNQMASAKVIKWKIIDTATKKENMDIDWKFKLGDKVKIKIFNDPKSQHPMQHPFHIHGQRFLVLATNGVKNENLVWKDTTLIQKGDTVEIVVDMENPGTWMAHCHIAEHLESGMMFNFEVVK